MEPTLLAEPAAGGGKGWGPGAVRSGTDVAAPIESGASPGGFRKTPAGETSWAPPTSRHSVRLQRCFRWMQMVPKCKNCDSQIEESPSIALRTLGAAQHARHTSGPRLMEAAAACICLFSSSRCRPEELQDGRLQGKSTDEAVCSGTPAFPDSGRRQGVDTLLTAPFGIPARPQPPSGSPATCQPRRPEHAGAQAPAWGS